MTKRASAKFKIDRRMGANLWGRAKSPITKRESRPGQHGQRRTKVSDYGQQLMAKQKLKGYYANIGERQFRRIYQEAVRRRGDSSENLIQLLERRLDTVVYRLKFAKTPFHARQMVNHGHITLNGKRVNIGSVQLKEGDVVAVREKSQQITVILEAQQSTERDVPDYLSLEAGKLQGTFVRPPQFAEVPYPSQMEPNLVIEYYSR